MPRSPKDLHHLGRNRKTCLWLRFHQGWPQKKVHHETGVPLRTLQRWEKVYREEGRSTCLKTGPKGPTKLTPRNLRRIERFCKAKQRRSTRKCARILHRKYGVTMSQPTIYRALTNKLGLYPYHRPKKPRLTPAHKEKRLQVAREFQDCISASDPNPWSNHCFTDEKRFNSEPKPNSKNDVIWDEAPDDDVHYNPRSKYGGHSVEVWGGITRFGSLPLIFIERPVHLVNGKQQRTPFRSPDFIREVLTPSVPRIKRMFNCHGIRDDEWTFQQDGDAKHKSTIVQSWLDKHVTCFTARGEWPTASPDLSPIENLWGIMDEELKELGGEKGFATREQFKRAIVKVWKSKTTKNTIKKLIDSVPKRMQEVIEMNGGHTTY